MTPRVAIVGRGPIGKRLADAVQQADDLRLEVDPTDCDVLVNCGGKLPAVSVPMVHGPTCFHPGAVLAPGGTARPGHPHVKVPCADALALVRLLTALAPLGPFTRLFSSCARRAGHATEARSASVDALEPVFALPEEDGELATLLPALVPDWHVRRTRVPYTHSHLHVLKIDCVHVPRVEEALALLRRAPGVLTSALASGLTDTGQVQEYFRDLGRPRGDRPEVFVWEPTLASQGLSLVLMADVSPEAVAIPVLLEVIRACVPPAQQRGPHA